MQPASVRRSLTLAVALSLGASVAGAGDDTGDIGYPTVDAAKTALQARNDVRMSLANGWLTIEDEANKTIWTFAPESDPAHPVAIKRTVIEEFDRVMIVMDIRCEGDVDACDALEEHFLSLNQATRDQVESANPDGIQP